MLTETLTPNVAQLQVYSEIEPQTGIMKGDLIIDVVDRKQAIGIAHHIAICASLKPD